MHPVIFSIGPVNLYGYGAMIAAGWIMGTALSARLSEQLGVSAKRIWDFSLVAVFAGIGGARLAYILFYPSEINSIVDLLALWRGGLMFQGGLVCAAIAGFLFARIYKIPAALFADCVVPGLALSQAFGRLGCFLAGCCYGKECGMPWAVKFTSPDALVPAVLLGVPLHPTQLYSALFCAAITVILVMLIRRGFAAHGVVGVSYLVLSSLARIMEEIFRGDDRGPALAGLSITMYFAIVVFMVSAVWLVVLVRRKQT